MNIKFGNLTKTSQLKYDCPGDVNLIKERDQLSNFDPKILYAFIIYNL